MDNSDHLFFFINNNKKIPSSNDNSIKNTKKTSLSNDNLININDIIEKNTNLDLYINNNIFHNSSDEKNIIDDENISEKGSNLDNSYISIDSKNYFIKLNQNDIHEMGKKIKKKYYQNDENLKKLNELSFIIKSNLLKYLYPKKEPDFYKICLHISKKIRKQKLLEKSILEKSIEYIFDKRVYFKYVPKIKIDKNFINSLGPILCYIYDNFNKYKIKDFESLKKAIKEIRNKNIDILNELYIYCNNNDLRPECANYEFLQNNKKNYALEPDLIFLLNIFQFIKEIEIDFDFEGEIFDDNEFIYFVIIIININYLFNDLKGIKLNLINRNFLSGIYEVNNQRIIKDAQYNLFFKKNNILFNKNIYTEKWDFENDFILDYYRQLKVEKPFYYKDVKLTEKEKESNNEEDNNIIYKTTFQVNDNIFKLNIDNINIDKEKEKEIKKRKTLTCSLVALIKKKNKKENNYLIEYYKKIIDNKNINILEMIFITLFSLDYFQNLEKMELIMNDSYFYEYCSFFQNTCEMNIGNIHILDLIYNKLVNVNSLNIEINSFELITFNRILKILYNNKNLSSFKCSFFSSDWSYFPQAIYKTNNQNILNKYNIKNDNYDTKNLNFRIEDIFFTKIYIYFERNLKNFFEIIKLKKLKILGLNFDIPQPLLNEEKYIIIITKFIINVIILSINNNNIESTIEELIILSPSLIINGNRLLFFDKFLQNIHNNKCLIKLNFQIKLYNISNIHKLLSERLKIINIGDFDLFSLKIFIENLTKYNFCQISSLEHIGISLNKTIIHLDEDIKLIFAKLFNIKIKNLSSINLFSNIEINKNEEFEEIINLLNDNWIPSYLLLFDDKSKNIINNNSQLLKTVNYIANKIKKNNKNKKTENIDNAGQILRCLRLLFNKKNDVILDFYSKKKIISNILKYLYICKPVNITFNLEKDNKYENNYS